MKRKSMTAGLALTAGLLVTALAVGPAGATPSPARTSTGFTAKNDAYLTASGHTVRGQVSVLANDKNATALVSNSKPTHGTLSIQPDGTFTYTPNPGFTGVDTFTYSASDAVKVFKTNLPPLATIGGVKITGGAYGSSLYPVPGSKDEYYGLTDRGPNVDGPNGTKVEPIPSFTPAIGKFKMTGTTAKLEKVVTLKAADGHPYNGQVNSQASTGETITDLNEATLAASPYGYDPEGLVALPDGTFWVSDEYGPFITHFDAKGRQIGRLSPFDASLPVELANRVPNKGMEGLTITPDGRTLVGIMQSALQQPDLTKKPASVTTLRIVTYDLRTHLTHEYLYLLDDPKINSGAVSEITALSNTTFLVDERDGNFEPGAYKKLFKVDLAGATDVGPHATLGGATYSAAKGGLLVGTPGQSIEAFVGTDDTATTTAALAGIGIHPVAKTLDVDLGSLLTTLDPSGGYFGHDKIEGVATTDHGRTLLISNDNDFGISGLTNSSAPFQLAPKLLPNGQQDDGEYLAVDTTKLSDPVSSATVSIYVVPKDVHVQR